MRREISLAPSLTSTGGQGPPGGVGYVMTLEGPHRQSDIVGIVLDQQNLSGVHTSLPSQREVECRALIDHALGPDPAAVPVDDASDRREPHARALEFGARVQALEHAE